MGPNSALKRCRRCQEIKKGSQFRYIQYFKKHRSICKRCEALGRRESKKSVEKHVREYGVTPGILKRIQTETNRDAARQARTLVLTNLSRVERIKYFVSRGLLWPCYCILYPLFILVCLSIWLSMTKGAANNTTEIFLAFAVTAGITACLYRQIRWIDREISSKQVSMRTRLYRDALQQRIEYETFYRSPEWRILRQTFLRGRKRNEGRFICDFCRNPIWLERDITVDHKKPRAKFPELAMSKDNLLLACRRCNSAKGAKLLSDEEFQLLLEKSKESNA
jgi:5-methylcytosine-specific restriction endonuclease McrA